MTNIIEMVIEQLVNRKILQNQYLFYIDSQYEMAEVEYSLILPETDYSNFTWYSDNKIRFTPMPEIKTADDFNQMIAFRKLQNVD